MLQRIPNLALSMLVALALAFGSLTPAPARAGSEDLVKALIVIGAACAISGACTGKNKRKRTARSMQPGGGYAVDAVAMTKPQRRLIQEGLRSVGFYGGTIDGSFGKGTRTAIRKYQASVGDKITGVLTGPQINTLAALSPAYASLPSNSVALFETDIARDTDKEELRRLQGELNRLGFNAGAEDGAMGGKTRAAIASYKTTAGLPGGPVPSRRLLARLDGVAYDAPRLAVGESKLAMLADETATDQGSAAFGEETLSRSAIVEPAPVVALHTPLSFEILDMRPGLSRRSIESMSAETLEGDIHIATGTAEQIGGSGALTLGHVVTQDAWPAPGSQQIVSLFDSRAPGEGAVAIFRTVLMPDDATIEDFQREVVPGLIEAYGTNGLIEGTLVWVGDGKRRAMARADGTTLADCGALHLTGLPRDADGAAVGWDAGGAPRLDAATSNSVRANCGDVLSVRFTDHAIQFSLWDSARLAAEPVDDAIAGAAEGDKIADPKLPKIKF